MTGDMRGFKLDRRFGTIFVAFNSLLHLTTNDELRDCFACVREHLVPGGAFVFDILIRASNCSRAPGEALRRRRASPTRSSARSIWRR